MTLAVLAAVGLNALSWQTSAHPAPIFSPKPERREAPPVRKAEPMPTQVPPTRPPVASVQSAPPPAPTPTARIAPGRDPIGDTIRASETGSISSGKAEPQKSSPRGAEPQKSVAAAQRALAKLGFAPGKVDGMMGAGTKQAIEKFERSRGLPVSGELGGRTLRELTAQAGMPAE